MQYIPRRLEGTVGNFALLGQEVPGETWISPRRMGSQSCLLAERNDSELFTAIDAGIECQANLVLARRKRRAESKTGRHQVFCTQSGVRCEQSITTGGAGYGSDALEVGYTDGNERLPP